MNFWWPVNVWLLLCALFCYQTANGLTVNFPSFSIELAPEHNGIVVLSKKTERVIWRTRPGKSILVAAIASDRVIEKSGSFDHQDKVRRYCYFNHLIS